MYIYVYLHIKVNINTKSLTLDIVMTTELGFSVLQKQRLEALKYFEAELGLVPEAVGGLYSHIEGVEDVTCLSHRQTYGRRDKARGAI